MSVYKFIIWILRFIILIEYYYGKLIRILDTIKMIEKKMPFTWFAFVHTINFHYTNWIHHYLTNFSLLGRLTTEPKLFNDSFYAESYIHIDMDTHDTFIIQATLH